VKLVPTILHDAVHGAVAVCQSELVRKGQTLHVQLESQHCELKGDPGRLRQVCWNLLQNAVKFTPQGGQVTVRTADLDGVAVLEVIDSGIGMEASTLRQIFRPFEQGPRTTLQNYGGLGLGLAITRALVEAHGGKITAWSEGTGRGATFRVTLPVNAPVAASEH
jgi:signal transduction histidine kinase